MTTSDATLTFNAQLFRSTRENAGLTRTALAHASGIHHTTLASWEYGRFTPEPHTIQPVAALLGLTLQELYIAHTPPNLTTYRLMAGLTIRTAAHQAHTTIFQLSQFENGAVAPTNDELRLLGWAYHTPPTILAEAAERTLRHTTATPPIKPTTHTHPENPSPDPESTTTQRIRTLTHLAALPDDDPLPHHITLYTRTHNLTHPDRLATLLDHPPTDETLTLSDASLLADFFAVDVTLLTPHHPNTTMLHKLAHAHATLTNPDLLLRSLRIKRRSRKTKNT